MKKKYAIMTCPVVSTATTVFSCGIPTIDLANIEIQLKNTYGRRRAFFAMTFSEN